VKVHYGVRQLTCLEHQATQSQHALELKVQKKSTYIGLNETVPARIRSGAVEGKLKMVKT